MNVYWFTESEHIIESMSSGRYEKLTKIDETS